METLLKDIRYGIRILIKSPIITVAALLTLALSIGATAAIFNVVYAILIRPLPYRDSSRLVMVSEKKMLLGFDWQPVSNANYVDWRDQNTVFEHIAATQNWNATLTGGVEPEQLLGMRATANFFPMLGVTAARGRIFSPDEDQPGRNRVVVLSHGFWQRRFGGDPAILDQMVVLNRDNYQVIGILPDDFQFASRDVEIFVPMALDPNRLNREVRTMLVFARLKPNVSLEQAQGEMSIIAQRLEQQHPKINTGWGISVHPMHEFFANLRNTRSSLLVLLAAVGFLLLIAIVNVASLLLARMVRRQKEIAIRLALGASRMRLIRQMLTESLVLSLLGGVAGFLVAYLGFSLILNIMPYFPTFRVNAITIDTRVFGFTVVLSIIVGIVFGLAPALQGSKPNLNDSLKEGRRGVGQGYKTRKIHNLLVVSEIAIAVVLLIGAGLVLRSFLRLQSTNIGFNLNNIVTMRVTLPVANYREPAQQVDFYKRVLEGIKTQPGIESAGAINQLPLSGLLVGVTNFVIEGRQAATAGNEFNANERTISHDYFATLGIPVLTGRSFTESDIATAPPVAIINQTMVNQYFPGEDPTTKRVKLGNVDSPGPWYSIVGVVGDIREVGLDSDPRPEIYKLYVQSPTPSMALVVRTASSPKNFENAVRRQVWAVDKDQPVALVRTMDEIVDRSIAPRRFSMLLMGILALVALLLAIVGIYGVVSYSVSQRTQEIGIRIALGAQRGDILKLVIKQVVVLVGTGLVIGLVGAYALTSFMSSLLYGIGTTDLATYVLIPVCLAVIALLAGYIPARRATKVDPIVALRAE